MLMKFNNQTESLQAEQMSGKLKTPFLNKRSEPRYPYCERIQFVYKNDLNEGILTNWSRSGLCMKTIRLFSEGDMITVSLPPSKYKENNRKAMIVWKKADGCGVQFCD